MKVLQRATLHMIRDLWICEGSSACHTYYDTGPRYLRGSSAWHSKCGTRFTNSSERIFYLFERIFYSNDLLIRPNESFTCPNESFICSNDSFICSNDLLIRPNESFICSNDKLIHSNNVLIRPNKEIFFWPLYAALPSIKP